MTKIKEDGRFQRSKRSRQIIIDAMIALIGEGFYLPTAQQVADKAAISIRTVFRHFSEMELLFKEMDEAMRPSYERHFLIKDFSGDLPSRIERIVHSRMLGYKEILHLERTTHLLIWRSEVIKKSYYSNQQLLRLNLIKMLPELTQMDNSEMEMVDALTAFEMFDRLYTFQKLSLENCCEIIVQQLLNLITK